MSRIVSVVRSALEMSAVWALAGCLAEVPQVDGGQAGVAVHEITTDEERALRYQCDSCRIQMTFLFDLGTGEDTPQKGAARVRTDRSGNFWLPNTYRPGTAAIYSPSGHFLRTVGREGDGPADMRYVGALARGRGKDMLLVDRQLRRLNYASADSGITHSTQFALSIDDVVPHRVMGQLVVNGRMGAQAPRLYVTDSAGAVLTTLTLSRMVPDNPLGRGDPSDAEIAFSKYGTYVIARSDAHASIFAANAAGYEVLEFAGDTLRRTLEGGIDWFQRKSASESARGPRLLDGMVDDSGNQLLLLFIIPDLDVDETLFKNHDPAKFFSSAQMDAGGDTVIEVWDIPTGQVLTGIRLDEAMDGFADSKHAYRLVETPDGDLRIRVWRIGIEKK